VIIFSSSETYFDFIPDLHIWPDVSGECKQAINSIEVNNDLNFIVFIELNFKDQIL
jgi:hypothetical protein